MNALPASLPLSANPPTVESRHQRFSALVDSYSSDLYRYACWLCKDSSQAHDLVQETFLRAWRAIDRLRESGAAKAWLFTILRRENARQYERIQPEWRDIEPDSLTTGQQGPEAVETWLLRRHVAGLEPKYREPLLLQVLGGFSCDEIATMLGLSRGAVMTRVFRAKQKLRGQLEA